MAKRQYFFKGVLAPAITPLYEGSIFIDTVLDLGYIATGASSSADWKKLALADQANVYTKQQNFNNGALVFEDPLTWDLADNQSTSLVLTANVVINAPLNIIPHGKYTIQLVQDPTGSRIVTWNAAFEGTAPTLKTAGDAVDIVKFVGNAAGDALIFVEAAATSDAKILAEDQVGTTYQVTEANWTGSGTKHTTIFMNNASPMTLTLALNATEAHEINQVIDVVREGAGTLTITSVVGVSLNNVDNNSIVVNNRNQAVSIMVRAVDGMIAVGDYT